MRPKDRIELSGPNGSGKSTLVRHIIGSQALTADQLIYLPQEVSAEDSARIIRELASPSLSPGEVRKVLLAIGISRVPHFTVMFEPTNQRDLPSIECLAAALSACEFGLLLVSHDTAFIEGHSDTRWEIADLPEGSARMRILPGKT